MNTSIRKDSEMQLTVHREQMIDFGFFTPWRTCALEKFESQRQVPSSYNQQSTHEISNKLEQVSLTFLARQVAYLRKFLFT